MTLSQKFWLWSVVLIALAATIGLTSLLNLRAIFTSARASMAYYSAMDRADAVDARVIWLRDSLRAADSARYVDDQFFAPIAADLAGVNAELSQTPADATIDGGQSELAQAMNERFAAARNQIMNASAADKKSVSNSVAAELDRVHASLTGIVRLAPDAARRQTGVTIATVQSALWWTCGWLLLVLLFSTAIHYRQYRALVRPLVYLRNDMRRSEATQFREEVRATGDSEFREVATYFNGLARDLANLYRGLEQKIIERSRALVRSERLASVGFLAAGVAHEINNPLNIISGYAELSAKNIRKVLDAESSGETHTEDEAAAEAAALAGALETQEIIRDEAFRCKEITNRLLSLARGGNDSREHLRLDTLARQVATLTKGLRNYRDRHISLDFAADAALDVVANPTEMKQVLLNLTVNALEASSTTRGDVRIGGRRDNGFVELYVQDAGKGMTAQTLEFIFEPFYTDKRGVAEAGAGLGLSISHAIVENHNGTITAQSAGPGTGSRFTIRIPAATNGHARIEPESGPVRH